MSMITLPSRPGRPGRRSAGVPASMRTESLRSELDEDDDEDLFGDDDDMTELDDDDLDVEEEDDELDEDDDEFGSEAEL